ncbi:MAG: four helix bundle protein [Gemmatimonadaceae bacterium]|nr:four helix bundle protein [Gemmatimonadaceae bacterium]
MAIVSATSKSGNGHRATIAQLRRSSASISANIAEGCSQPSQDQFARFLSIAIGSTTESHNHLLLLRDTAALPADQVTDLLDRVTNLRPALIKLHRLASQRQK